VLSRIAESLYWVGRYIERAEDTSRILDVHFLLLLEQPEGSEQASCENILRVMGADLEEGRVATTAMVNELLAFEPRSAASIVGALSAARQNASGAREVIPSEMWQALNATYNQLPGRRTAATVVPHHFFQWVKERAALLNGLADSLMSRDDGWQFLLLGRSLERVDMTARLLTARFAPGMEATGWVTTLKCCSAHEAYLRTYRRAVDASLVAEFLLLDRLFPRSIFSALSSAERCLAELSPTSGRVGLEDEARRLLGRARNDLEYRQLGELLSDLPAFLASVQAACAAAGSAVGARYFLSTEPVEWIA
jgi:uncharacterized alpha-E superfamily protein